jgi:KRAB domain-containing zinc finger protein
VHEQSGQYGCDFCDKKFLKKTAKGLHERKHTKPFVCDHCGKAFDRQSSLNRHSELHGGKPYRCDKCGENFTSYKARREGLKCEKCNVALSKVLPQITPTVNRLDAEAEGQNFIKQEEGSKDENESNEEEATSYSLYNDKHKKDDLVHKMEELSAETEIIQCQICLKTFTKWSNLNRHKKLHDEQVKEEKPVENPCIQDLKEIDDNEVVEETYSEQTLEETEVEVTENSSLGTENQCHVCLKSFGRRSSLTCHIKDVHEQSGDYACGFCDKKFYKESTKIVHERMHTGKKPYACDKC